MARAESTGVRALRVGALVLLVLAVIAVRPSSLGGPTSLVVVSGDSMLPAMESGDLAFTFRRGSYAPGDVIAFQLPGRSGRPVVIHRVVGGSGTGGYVMQGDNRDHADPWEPTDQDVLGSSFLTIPGGGRYLQTLQQPLVLAAFFGALTVLLVLLGSSPRNGEDRGPGRRQRGGRRAATRATAAVAVARKTAPLGRRSAARVARRRARRHGTLVVLGIVALSVMAGTGFVAAASHLMVDGGTIQLLRADGSLLPEGGRSSVSTATVSRTTTPALDVEGDSETAPDDGPTTAEPDPGFSSASDAKPRGRATGRSESESAGSASEALEARRSSAETADGGDGDGTVGPSGSLSGAARSPETADG